MGIRYSVRDGIIYRGDERVAVIEGDSCTMDSGCEKYRLPAHKIAARYLAGSQVVDECNVIETGEHLMNPILGDKTPAYIEWKRSTRG